MSRIKKEEAGNKSNTKHRMKHVHAVRMSDSIRTKLIIVLIMLLGLSMFSFWLMNYAMLSPFYERSKIKTLAASYKDAEEILSSDVDYDDGDGTLSSNSELKLEILDENRSTHLYVFRVENYWGQLAYSFDYPSVSKVQQGVIRELTEAYLYGDGEETSNDFEGKNRSLIRKTKQYNVYKVYDSRIGSYYLELFGQLKNGPFIYVRTNYQSMKESITIFNKFIVYSGLGIMILGVLLMVFYGNRFAKPILQITDIAKRMSELDFDVKYPVTTHDEIGVLGTSINILSEKLETTISELKSANNELQKDIEKKTQVDEMRKEFISNVSHELKTPIALIQGYAEGLQENINDDEGSREFYCEVIVDEAQKMNRMVQKLLTLNQIEFGNTQVSFERFDIVGLTKNVIQSARLLAENKDASIEMFQGNAPIYVWADQLQVEEVLTNYISNAINHVNEEHRITVTMEQRGQVVRVKVFNTGEQIPEEDLEKIWVKFYKVDKARTREYGGSGIGLSIVKAIMDSMNQKCGVNNMDNGVEFWFELDIQN